MKMRSSKPSLGERVFGRLWSQTTYVADPAYRPKVRNLNSYTWSKTAAKTLSFVVVMLFGLQLFWMIPNASHSYGVQNNPYDSWLWLFWFSQMILTFLLAAFLGDFYWIINKKKQLDERQMAVRRRIFEKSYKILSLLVVIAPLLLLPIYRDAIRGALGSSVYLNSPLLPIMYFIIGLPSIIAAWEKDA